MASSSTIDEYMGYVFFISGPKTATSGVNFRTLRIQINVGFDYKTLTFNAFENRPSHNLEGIDVSENNKVSVQVRERKPYFNLVKITTCEFEDCYRCEGPVVGLQLGPKCCLGCYSVERPRVYFDASVTEIELRDYEYGEGTLLKFKTDMGEDFVTVFYPRNPFELTLKLLNVGEKVKGAGWVIDNNLLKVFSLVKA